jgi:hypothetical protein
MQCLHFWEKQLQNNSKNIYNMEYSTPHQYKLELHFPRSRFSRDFEDTLILLSSKMVQLGTISKEQFETQIDAFLHSISNRLLTEKTIANQRTEMLRLYGLGKYIGDDVIVGNRTYELIKNQDIPRFFKSLCNRFQFPSGINKIQFTSNYVAANVRFKPAQYIIRLLRAGKEITGKSVAVTAKEIAHFVFNDIRVTVNQESPKDCMNRLLDLRKSDVLCSRVNDIIRYARDFMNFMVQANLLIEYNKTYILNEREKPALDFIEKDNSFFDEYNKALMPDGSVNLEIIRTTEEKWHNYFTDVDTFEENALNTTIEAFEKETIEVTMENNTIETVTTGFDIPKALQQLTHDEIGKIKKVSTKDIGDEGELIVYGMERERVLKIRPDLLALVRIVSNDTSLGFDVQSVYDNGMKKYIEVKTTKRNYTPEEFNGTAFFTISYNEWLAAQQHGDNYYIFRVIITKEKLSIFVIQNPFQKEIEKTLSIFPTEYRLIYTEQSGYFWIKDKIYLG